MPFTKPKRPIMPTRLRSAGIEIIDPPEFRSHYLGTLAEYNEAKILINRINKGELREQDLSVEQQQKCARLKLPYRVYTFKAAIVGTDRNYIGIMQKQFDKYKELLTPLLTLMQDPKLFSSPDQKNALIIKKALQNHGEIAKEIIFQLYQTLTLNFKPWNQNKVKVLTKYKKLFSQLVINGAEFDHLRKLMSTKEIFQDLIDYALDEAALTAGLAMNELPGGENLGFNDFIDAAKLYLSKGASLTVPLWSNPEYGTYLHWHLAYELSDAAALIVELANLRKQFNGKAHACMNFQAKDGFAHTPLLLSLLTRNDAAVKALLDLNRQGIPVGIDIRDSEGRSPLMIAAAMGMADVVEDLLLQGANPCVTDSYGHGLDHYAHLSKEDVRTMIGSLLDIDRNEVLSLGSKRSHFYGADIEGSAILWDDKLLTLSALPEHTEVQDQAEEELTSRATSGEKWAIETLEFFKIQRKALEGTRLLWDICKTGQAEVQAYLLTPKAKAAMKPTKEKLLRRACALGDKEVLKALLVDDKISPNAVDHLKRNALHFLVMRVDLIKTELGRAMVEQGISLSETELERQAKEAFERRPEIIKFFLQLCEQHDIKPNTQARNSSGNTPGDILSREIGKKDAYHKIFLSCQTMIAEVRETKEPEIVETEPDCSFR